MAGKGHAKGTIKGPDVLSSVIVDTSNAERSLNNFITKLNKSKKQLEIDVGLDALKDARKIWDAMVSEMNQHGETDIFKGLAETFENADKAFRNMKATLNGEEIKGFAKIIQTLSSADINNITKLDFGMPNLKNNILEVKKLEAATEQMVKSEQKLSKAREKNTKQASVDAGIKKQLSALKRQVSTVSNANLEFRIDTGNIDEITKSTEKLERWAAQLTACKEKLEALKQSDVGGMENVFEEIDNAIQNSLENINNKIVNATEMLRSASVHNPNVSVDIGINAAKLKKQADATRELAEANEEFNKSIEKSLKLSRVKGQDDRNIPQTYSAVNGKYLIEKGTVGWNVYDNTGEGYGELIASYETLKELREDTSLITEQEAKANERLAASQEKVVKTKKEVLVKKPELLEWIDILDDKDEMYDAKTISQKRKVAEEYLKAQYRLYKEMKAEYEAPDEATHLYGTDLESLFKQQSNMEAYVALYEKYGGKIEKLSKGLQKFVEFNGFAGSYQYALDEYNETLRQAEQTVSGQEQASDSAIQVKKEEVKAIEQATKAQEDFNKSKNEAWDKQDSLTAEYEAVGAELDALERKYNNILGIVRDWQELNSSMGQLSGKNNKDLRKNVLQMLSGVSPELAIVIGDSFTQGMSNGFKGIATKDIVKMISRIENMDLLGGVSELLSELENIHFSDIDTSFVNSIKENHGYSEDAIKFLEEIVQKRQKQLEITEKLAEAQWELFDAMGAETAHTNSLLTQDDLVRIESERKAWLEADNERARQREEERKFRLADTEEGLYRQLKELESARDWDEIDDIFRFEESERYLKVLSAIISKCENLQDIIRTLYSIYNNNTNSLSEVGVQSSLIDVIENMLGGAIGPDAKIYELVDRLFTRSGISDRADETLTKYIVDKLIGDSTLIQERKKELESQLTNLEALASHYESLLGNRESYLWETGWLSHSNSRTTQDDILFVQIETELQNVYKIIENITSRLDDIRDVPLQTQIIDGLENIHGQIEQTIVSILDAPIQIPARIDFDVEQNVVSQQDQVKAIEDAYDAAYKNVNKLREELSAAREEQEKLCEEAELYGYTAGMSALRAGKAKKSLSMDSENNDYLTRSEFIENHMAKGFAPHVFSGNRRVLSDGGTAYELKTKEEFEYAKYLEAQIKKLNVGWEKGLEILWNQNGQLKAAEEKVEAIREQLEEAESIAETAYERMSYAHSGIIGDEAIRAHKVNLVDKDRRHNEASIQQMQETAKLIGDFQNKYSDRFQSIFGSLGVLNVENAKQIYDELIAKEQAYISELQKRTLVVQEFVQENQKALMLYQKVDGFEQKFGELSAAILQDGLNKDDANKQLSNFINSLDTKDVIEGNNLLISSYEDLYKALEKVVDLSKQLKPESTAEFDEMYGIMDQGSFPRSKDDLISEIKAQYDNVKRIKSSIKNGLSAYKYIDGSGYEAEYGIDGETLKEAENTLRSYIYQAVEYFGYTVADVMNDFDKKRVRAFVEDRINEYLDVSGKNDKYRIDAEAFNAPIKEALESIIESITNMARDEKSKFDVNNLLQDFVSRPMDVNRYTLSTQSNYIGTRIGLSTPYDDVKANAKKIESYQELCDIVSEYNRLQRDATIFGGTEYPGLSEEDEIKRVELRERLKSTGGQEIFKLSGFSGFDNVDSLATALGIEIPVEIPVTPVIEPKPMHDKIAEAVAAEQKLLDSAKQVEQTINKQTDAALEAADAIKKQEDAEEDLQDEVESGEEDSDKKIRIIEKTVKDALAQLRNAKDNKNLMIDLSEVSSPGDLQSQIGGLVQSALGADLSVGDVVVADDIAKIGLYNKELGITTQQIWQLKKATEDATEARLEFIKADPLKVDFKKSQKYAEDQQKALDDSEKSLLGYQKRLDTLTRSYQHGSKTLKGESGLLLPDATTLESDADKTLDGLATHIKNRIDAIRKRLATGDNITRDEQNLFIQDLNALENEIKIMQADKYKAGNMSATEVSELRKSLTAMLDTLASKARKNNVFDSISESYNELYNNLNNPELPGYLSDQNISDAVQRIRTLSKETTKEIQIAGESKKEQQDLQNLLNLQERLYKAKKEYATLEIKGELDSSKGMEATRHLEDLEAQYKASEKLLKNEESRARLAQQRAQLDAELNKVIEEQTKIKNEEESSNFQVESQKSIKQNYQAILDTVNKINSIDKDILKYQEKDGGTGLFTGYIKNLQSEKAQLISQLNTISGEINDALGGVFSQGKSAYSVPSPQMLQGSNTISDFLNDTRTQAALTSTEIEKLISSLKTSQNLDLESATKYVEQFSSVQETYQRLSKLTGLDKSNKDYQALASVYGQILKYKDQLSSDPRSWTPEENAHLQSLIKTFTEYGNVLADVGEKEAKYFSGKTKYVKGQDISNEINKATEDAKKLFDIQKRLEEAAKGIVESKGLGSPIVTDFSQGADGIFRLDFSAFDETIGALRTFRVEMGSVTEGIYQDETTISKSFANIQSAAKQLKSVGDLITRLGKSGFNIGEETAEPRIRRLLELYRQLSAEVDKGENADQSIISKLTKDSKLAAAEVEKLYKKHIELQSAIDRGDAQKIGNIDPDGDIYKQLTGHINDFVKVSDGANVKIGAFNAVNGQLQFTMEATDGTVQKFTVSLDKLGKQAVVQQAGVDKLKSKWQQFTDSLKGTGKQFMTAMFGMNMFYTAIAQVRKGYQYVKDIDLAMTELKKVTDETSLAYDNFLSTASKSASIVGSTVSDFTSATANFARLGYSMEESAEMAKTAIVYRNVADGLDTVEESTDSIISTMKAFGIESDDTMSIIDRFNEVGNNFAITSAGIGDALQRSASALFEAGNTIDESIALVTAANSVIQNPEQVGTALKTLALRLRGAKVELEDAGLETDNMAESTSQLQAKLKALTHGKVDIMLNEDTFKSTTQILREMSDAWTEMTDIERASALELMGGKRQANILASVIKNFDTVEDVIKTSMNSQGSAMAENEKYLDSIQGKTDILTNSMQTLWSNAISSDFAKSLLDIANTFIKAADGAGLLNTVISLIAASSIFKKNKDGSNSIFGEFLSIFKYDNDGFGLNKNSAIGQIMSGAATGGISGAATAFKSLGAGAKFAAAGTKLLNGALTMGISLIAGITIEALIQVLDALIVTNEELIEQADELQNAYSSQSDTINQNISTLQGLQSEFDQLSKGVDDYGNNISLATDDYARYQEIVETIVGISPSLIDGYDAEGNAIANKNGLLEESIRLMQEEQRLNAQKLTSDDNLETIAGSVEAKTEEYKRENPLPYGSAKSNFMSAFAEGLYGDDLYDVFRALSPEGYRWNDYSGAGADSVYAQNFAGDFYDAIVADLRSEESKLESYFTLEQRNNMLKYAKEYVKNVQVYNKDIEGITRELTSALQTVPLSETSYYTLSDEMKGYLTQYIDGLDVTIDNILEKKQDIIDLTNFIANNPNAQSALSDGFKLNLGQDKEGNILTFKEYKAEIDKFIQEINNSEYTDEQKNTIFDLLGLNTDSKEFDNEIQDAVAHAKNLLQNEFDDDIDNLSISDILITTKITEDPNGLTFEELKRKIQEIKDINGIDVVSSKTYSALVADIESYNEILSQTSEVVSDNIEVTQEYKDSLKALGISEEELGECFYKNNPLIVKNSTKLNNLVKSAKKATSQNIKLAKSQARLQYYKLYKELSQLTNGRKIANGATLAQVNSLYKEMTALQKTIARYSILEQKLLGATNAYEEFAKAQEIDSEFDYESKAEEMVGHLVDAFHTAKLGTESAQAAIKGLVPESVYADLDTLDEKMQAVYDYFTTDLSKYFYVKFNDDGSLESAEMLIDNVKKFVEDGITNGVFIGSWEEWDLDPSIKSLDQLADQMNVTKEVAFAFLQAMETYDISWIGGDASTLMDKLLPTSAEVKAFGEQMKDAYQNVGLDKDIDLTQRVKVSREVMLDKGWDIGNDDYATLNTISAYASEFGLLEEGQSDYAINLTPILPDGTVIEGGEDAFKDWIRDELASGKTLDDLNIVVGVYSDMDSAVQEAEKLHKLQEEYYAMVESHSLENDIYRTTQKQTELQYKIGTGQISPDTIVGADGKTTAEEQLIQLNREAEENAKAARENAAAWAEAQKAYDEASDAVIDLQDQLENSVDDTEIKELQKQLEAAEGTMWDTYATLVKLGEPTELTLTVAEEQVQRDLERIKAKMSDVELDIVSKINIDDLQKDSDGNWIVDITAYSNLDPASQARVQEYLDYINEQHVIDAMQGDGVTTTLDTLNEIKDILQKSYELMVTTTIDPTSVNTWWAEFSAAPWYKKIYMVAEKVFSDGWASGTVGVNGTAHAFGTAHKNGSWGAPRTETALVGELGPELLVRNGRWTTIGDNGAEFRNIKKGDIIFNHKQTEDLLSKGYVTGRGKLHGDLAFTNGTAYAVHPWIGGIDIDDDWENIYPGIWDDATDGEYLKDDSDDSDSSDDGKDDAEEVVDFIEMKLEEIEAIIEKTTTRIENFLDDTTDIKSKDELYDELVKAEKDKSEAYLKAAQKYNVEAAAALSGVPQKYQEMARNGAIAIKDFIGEDQVEIADKIQEYRDWAAKADEAENGHLAAIAAISAHRVEQLEDIATDFENIISISQSHSDLLQAEMDFIEESGDRLSEDYYEDLKKHSQRQLDDMQAEREALQKILDDSVAAGDVVVGSDDWYSMLDTIYEVDQEIIDCKTSLEEFQNAINELHWDNFDKLITEIDNVNSELSNLYDLISDDDKIVDDMGNWTDEGITVLGLLAQQMENAQFKAQEYGDAIDKLKRDYADGLYSTDEYNERLADLTESQYDAIKSYEDAKDAIVDLNKTRVDAVKDGLQKEIDAYSELIEKKKESLSSDKEAYDFQKQIQESNENIKDIERQIAVLEGNTSSSAMAQRKRLEAELLKAREELQDLYYDHSVEKQQEALDKELEDYTQNKQDQMDALDEYLEKEEQVISDSFGLIAENTKTIANTLISISEEYGVTISDTIATPWVNGANAIGTYEEQLNTSVSATTENLESLKKHLEDLQVQADKTAESIVNATHSTIVETNDGHQTSIKGYAKGSKSVEYDQWALIDELGDELQLVPNAAGRLDYIKKGTGILNNTLTERLMDLAIDPTSMIESSRPAIGAPGIMTTNNNISIDMHIAEVVHIDHADNNSLPDITKAVKTQMDNYMRDINNKLRRK